MFSIDIYFQDKKIKILEDKVQIMKNAQGLLVTLLLTLPAISSKDLTW